MAQGAIDVYYGTTEDCDSISAVWVEFLMLIPGNSKPRACCQSSSEVPDWSRYTQRSPNPCTSPV